MNKLRSANPGKDPKRQQADGIRNALARELLGKNVYQAARKKDRNGGRKTGKKTKTSAARQQLDWLEQESIAYWNQYDRSGAER